jgi:hypothetical protein
MVIEHFRNGDAQSVYRRFGEKGRMLPDGLHYSASWTDTEGSRCFQVMECAEPGLLKIWASRWDDLVDFEFIPVVTGAEMAEKMK